MRNAFKHLGNINDKEFDEFFVWAFGNEVQEGEDPMVYLTAWNVLHGEDHHLKPESLLGKDIPAMVNLWKNR